MQLSYKAAWKRYAPGQKIPKNDHDRAEIRIEGIEPTDERWRRSAPALRQEFWKIVGKIALAVYDRQVAAGLDRNGRPMKRVQIKDRPRFQSGKHVDGPPLTPHRALSRTRRLLTYRSSSTDVVLHWKKEWGTILLFHADGPLHNKNLPVRDVIGIAPSGMAEIERVALGWWRTGKLPDYVRNDNLMRGTSVDVPYDKASGFRKAPLIPTRYKFVPLGYTPIHVERNTATGAPSVTPGQQWTGWGR